jgi:hypothetical protein
MILLTTCADDERSCQQCIKRDLQNFCHDEVKKKAKYLHDASNEFLMSSMRLRDVGNRFQYVANLVQGPSLSHETIYSISSVGGAYAHSLAVPTIYSMYASSASSEESISMSLIDSVVIPSAYSAQVSLISPHFTLDLSNQASSMQSMTGVLRQNSQITPNSFENTYDSFIFDLNDPMHYNFDLANFNFENHYDALKFDMLDHMFFDVMKTASDDVIGSLFVSMVG